MLRLLIQSEDGGLTVDNNSLQAILDLYEKKIVHISSQKMIRS